MADTGRSDRVHHIASRGVVPGRFSGAVFPLRVVGYTDWLRTTNLRIPMTSNPVRRLVFSLTALWVVAGILVCVAPATASPGAAPAGAAAARQAASGADADECPTALGLGGVGLSAGTQFRLTGNQANFGFHDRTVGSDPPGSDFLNQRLRAWVNVHDREECRYGAYVQLQAGGIELGSGREFAKTFGVTPGRLGGTDQTGVALRRGFLWYKPSANSLLRAGVLSWEDRFGERPTFGDPLWAVDRHDTAQAPLANSVWDFNVGGITFEATAHESWHYALGALILQRDSRAGDGDSWLLTADVDRTVGSSIWGASVYYVRDHAGNIFCAFGGPASSYGRVPGEFIQRSNSLWVGGRGHLEHDGGSTALFLIMNRGETPDYNWSHTGWAAKVATALEAGAGTAHLRVLYSTGNAGNDPTRSGEFRTIAQTARNNRGAGSYWSLLGLTSPRGPSDGNDLGIGLQNDGLGLLTLQGGYEQPVSDGWTAFLAAGWLRADQPNPLSGSPDIGTELLAEARWQMASPLALDIGGSVLLTGDFFRAGLTAPAPAALYELYSRWQLEF